jgi:hypothetical protein
MWRRRQLGIIALFLAVVAGTGGWIYYQQHRFKHFAVHDPGMVYRSAWLSPDALSQLIDTYRIRSVVNLCDPKQEMTPQQWEGERHAVAGAGATLYAIPLPNSVNVDPKAWEPHLAILANPDNYPMLVHCQHGVTRTSMFLTAYDVICRHKRADDSLAVQPTFGHGRADVHVRAFAKNFEQFVNESRVKSAGKPPLGEVR